MEYIWFNVKEKEIKKVVKMGAKYNYIFQQCCIENNPDNLIKFSKWINKITDKTHSKKFCLDKINIWFTKHGIEEIITLEIPEDDINQAIQFGVRKNILTNNYFIITTKDDIKKFDKWIPDYYLKTFIKQSNN